MISLKHQLVFLIAGLSSVMGFAQNADRAFVKTVKLPGPFVYFTTDKLQNIYALTTNNEVIKYNPTGIEQFRFNNNYLGDLTLIDATDPFNLLLFYTDFQTAITLDRTLSNTGEVILTDLNLINVKVLATANDNNLWLYDDITFQLKKIDRNGGVLSSSEDLNLLLGQAPSPTQMQARDNFVYLNDPKIGMIVFDNFGQYHKTLTIKDISDFQVLDHRLIYQQPDGLFVFDQNTLRTNRLQLPQGISHQQRIRLQKNMLYVLTADGGIEVFKF